MNQEWMILGRRAPGADTTTRMTDRQAGSAFNTALDVSQRCPAREEQDFISRKTMKSGTLVKGIFVKHFLSTTGVVIALAATCVSCDKIRPPQPELQKPPAASGQVDQQEGERKEFAQTAQKELDELRSAIAEFKAKAETANAGTKAKLGEEVGKLEAELRDTQQRLVALKSATVDSWNQMKEAFGNSLAKLKTSIENFRKSAT